MYPKKLRDIENLAVRMRVTIERRIVRSLVDEFSEQGFTFQVDDGGEEYIPASTPKQALDALLNTDEDQLGIVQNGEVIGWIRLIYGNDGWDVMSDWHTNLDKYMPKTLAFVESEEF